MVAFIQIIEITTSRIDEIEALDEEWRAQTEGRRTAQRVTITEDRDRPNTYIQLVEFPSYEAAMANSDLPETAAFAERLAKLCDAPPSFRNLDVRRVEEL
jgi:quinol monooxygenase YgiN